MYLHRLTSDDADIPELRRMLDETEYLSPSEEYFNYVTSAENVSFFKITDKSGVVGGVQCEIHGTTLYIAVVIDKSHRRNGYAENALRSIFEQFCDKADRIEVSIDRKNEASLRLFGKLGFREIGAEGELIIMERGL